MAAFIAKVKYSPRGQIPSETEITKISEVTRMTACQAIYLLIQEGLLYRKRGAGTFVTANMGVTAIYLHKIWFAYYA